MKTEEALSARARANQFVADNLQALAIEVITLWDTACRPSGGAFDALEAICRGFAAADQAHKVAEHMILDACARTVARG